MERELAAAMEQKRQERQREQEAEQSTEQTGRSGADASSRGDEIGGGAAAR